MFQFFIHYRPYMAGNTDKTVKETSTIWSKSATLGRQLRDSFTPKRRATIIASSVYCWAICHCQRSKNIACWATYLLWWIYVAGNTKTRLVRPSSESRIFLSDFNEAWIFKTDFNISPQHQISRISSQWRRRWNMRTDGRLSRICERSWQLISVNRFCAHA